MSRHLVHRYSTAVLVTVAMLAASAARADEGEATTSSAAPERFFTRTYTKAELAETVPANPLVSLESRAAVGLGSLFGRVTDNQSTTSQADALRKIGTARQDDDVLALNRLFLREPDEDHPADVAALRSHLTRETRRAASQELAGRVVLFDRLARGVTLDLSFSGATDTAPAAAPRVRYDLVPVSIEPPAAAPGRAAIADIDSELDHAVPATVTWTIGPVVEDEAPLFLAPQPEAALTPSGDDAEDAASWRLRRPSPKIETVVRPENWERLGTTPATDSGAGMGPGYRVEARQIDGLYRCTYRAPLGGGASVTEHEVGAPVVGALRVGRTFDDSWTVTRTSGYGLLADERLPRLDVHRLHVEDRVQADLGSSVGPHTLGVTARTRARGSVEREVERPASVALQYQTSF